MNVDALPFFVGGMIVGIFLTIFISFLSIGLYKSEVLHGR